MKAFGITMIHEGDTVGPDKIKFVSDFEKFIYSDNFPKILTVFLTLVGMIVAFFAFTEI